jgi:hypothetical protein
VNSLSVRLGERVVRVLSNYAHRNPHIPDHDRVAHMAPRTVATRPGTFPAVAENLFLDILGPSNPSAQSRGPHFVGSGGLFGWAARVGLQRVVGCVGSGTDQSTLDSRNCVCPILQETFHRQEDDAERHTQHHFVRREPDAKR